MKTIENKKVEINKEGQMPIKDSYCGFIKSAINTLTPQGLTYEDIRWRLKVEDVLAKSTDVIVLEDAEFDKVKKSVNTMSWLVIDQQIIDFVDYINGL